MNSNKLIENNYTILNKFDPKNTPIKEKYYRNPEF
jgi:hypothetical protein